MICPSERYVYLIQIRWCSEFFTYVYVYWIRNSGPKTKECACILSCWDDIDQGNNKSQSLWNLGAFYPSAASPLTSESRGWDRRFQHIGGHSCHTAAAGFGQTLCLRPLTKELQEGSLNATPLIIIMARPGKQRRTIKNCEDRAPQTREFSGSNREQKRHIRKNHVKYTKTSGMPAGCPWHTRPVSRQKCPLLSVFRKLTTPNHWDTGGCPKDSRPGDNSRKQGSGNKFLWKMPENSQKLLPVLVLNFGEIFALQYGAGNFSGSSKYTKQGKRLPKPAVIFHHVPWSVCH